MTKPITHHIQHIHPLPLMQQFTHTPHQSKSTNLKYTDTINNSQKYNTTKTYIPITFIIMFIYFKLYTSRIFLKIITHKKILIYFSRVQFKEKFELSDNQFEHNIKNNYPPHTPHHSSSIKQHYTFKN